MYLKLLVNYLTVEVDSAMTIGWTVKQPLRSLISARRSARISSSLLDIRMPGTLRNPPEIILVSFAV
jgi:hypothetical protein